MACSFGDRLTRFQATCGLAVGTSHERVLAGCQRHPDLRCRLGNRAGTALLLVVSAGARPARGGKTSRFSGCWYRRSMPTVSLHGTIPCLPSIFYGERLLERGLVGFPKLQVNC